MCMCFLTERHKRGNCANCKSLIHSLFCLQFLPMNLASLVKKVQISLTQMGAASEDLGGGGGGGRGGEGVPGQKGGIQHSSPIGGQQLVLQWYLSEV